ncbi:MAG: hypothetical protein ACRBI6_07410 [Acidimicrobiales bacterium]
MRLPSPTTPTAPDTRPVAPTATVRRRPGRRLVGALVAVATLATACGDGDATRDDLVANLTDVADFSQAEAECVADAIYDSGDWTQDELNSVGGGLVDDEGNEKVPGFGDALDAAVASCAGRS